MKQAFFSKFSPLLLLGGLLLCALITICTQANAYGISMDEPIQDHYGQAVMKWYVTLGKDRTFLTGFPADTYMPEHGGIFDAVVAATQDAFPHTDHWIVRHLVTALTGLLGLVAIALSGYELGGYWAAFLAALALWLYPRYYGAIYNNPKDVPAAVTTLFVMWAALLLIRQWGEGKHVIRNSILLGVCLGIAVAVRATAVIWYLILGLLVLWWLFRGRCVWREKLACREFMRQLTAAIIGGITSWLTMIVLWPYVLLDPVKNLFESIKIMSQYPWNGPVLYDGAVIPAIKLPRTYALQWLLIGSPPTLVFFALLGLSIAYAWCIRKRLDPKIVLVILSLVVPLGVMIGKYSVLYDGLRQFLFLIPSMILLAVYGCMQTMSYLANRKRQVLRLGMASVVIVTLSSYVPVAKEMIDLSPFAYTYFSPLIGGLAGAQGKFVTDYWATCSRQAAEWLVQNYQRYTTSASPSVKGAPYQSLIAPFLSPAFHEDDRHPDFYIASTRDNLAQDFPMYKVIHTVGAEGVPFCVIKVNPAL